MNEEEVKSRLPKEKIEAIKLLKKSRWTDTEVAIALDIDRKTVAVYRPPEEETEEKEKKEELPQPVPISGEEYRTLYTLFEKGKSKVEAVVETGETAKVVSKVFEDYCTDKGMPHINEIVAKLEDNSQKIDNLKNDIGTLNYIVSSIMGNFKFAVGSLLKGNEDVFLCPHCRMWTHFIQNEQGVFVCRKCGKPPFSFL